MLEGVNMEFGPVFFKDGFTPLMVSMVLRLSLLLVTSITCGLRVRLMHLVPSS